MGVRKGHQQMCLLESHVFVRVTSSGSKEGSVTNVLLDSHLVVIRSG